MKQQHVRFSIAAALAALCAPAAHAVDVTAGDWKLSFDGNVNADYIYSNCESLDRAQTIGGGLTCVAPGDGQRSSSSVSNGLLPAALSISAATTQAGYDIAVTFGLYPGISTNDGGSPNLGNTSSTRNTALGTAGLDVRQVFLTFGNKASREIVDRLEASNVRDAQNVWVGTFHQFGLEFIRKYHDSFGVDPDVQVLDKLAQIELASTLLPSLGLEHYSAYDEATAWLDDRTTAP